MAVAVGRETSLRCCLGFATQFDRHKVVHGAAGLSPQAERLPRQHSDFRFRLSEPRNGVGGVTEQDLQTSGSELKPILRRSPGETEFV
jgi:hypothetical protein